MQYERLTDTTSLIVTENGESQLVSSSLGTNRKICHTRKSILILLIVQLVSSIMLLQFFSVSGLDLRIKTSRYSVLCFS